MTVKRSIGPLDAAQFMERHWQREPLLVRKAFANFRDPLSPREVLALAQRDDAASRLVTRRGRRWSLEHGPFAPAAWKRLPARDWTVLVQDTNHFSARAERLLARFDFVPHARVDDLMVSYAVPGGGVGPHVDSYDVFLLQGHGRRRWQVSGQSDLAFVPGLPLRILERFRPEQEWVLEPGDMLYLPPGVAHDGVALTECLTWSVGFRAPSDAELVGGFLDHLRDALQVEGHYGDAGARPVAHPGEVPSAMLDHAERALAAIRWTPAEARAFAARHLSEPKAHVFFEPPRRPLPRAAFGRAAAARGLRLDGRTRLLFSGTMFFINGQAAALPAAARSAARRLSDARAIAGPARLPEAFVDVAHEWYRQGYLHLGGEGR